MRYSQRYQMQMVDQWRQCYINYSQLKLYLSVIQACNKQSIYLTQQFKMQQRRSIAKDNEDILGFILKRQVTSFKKELIDVRREQFKKMAENVNEMFMHCFKKNLELYRDFVGFKYEEIISNFHICRNFYYLAKTEDFQAMRGEYRHYLQYLYVQSHYLSLMVRSNIQAQNRILQKHKLNAHGIFPTPQPETLTYLKIQKCNQLKRQIQTFYVQINKKTMNKSRDRIHRIGQQVQYNKHVQSLFIGLLSGALVTIIIFMCIILSRQQIVLEIDPIFNQYFPLWRGISFFIFYTWMLGSNLFYFERYKISHKIILENQFIRYPKSNDLFKIASFFSIIFIILFVIYALQLADLIETYEMSPQWLPLFIWGIFLLFMINPFPTLFIQGRLYIFKMLLKVITSIFIPADFLSVVAVTQLFALINAFQDTVYTICFYTNLSLPLPLEQTKQPDICKTPATISKFVFTLFLYTLRAWHCIRGVYLEWGKQPFYKTINFLNTLKFTSGLITTILSYLYNSNRPEILPAWIVFATITQLYSFGWDCRVSFDVLNIKSKNFMLRDEIIFPKINYYIWVVSTFFLRLTWVLYISPNISKSLLGSPEIFLLVFGYLQIIRRGIWNVIRLELEQVRNRQVFRAVPKQKDTIEDKIYKLVQKNSAKSSESAQAIVVQEGVIMEADAVPSQKTRKKKNIEQKKRLVKIAKQHFEQELTKRLQVEQYKKEIQQKIEQLIKKVYD